MTKQDLHTHNAALDLVNISVRLYRAQRDLIDRANSLVPDRTLSEYVRDVMTMQAALDLGVELPRVPEIRHGRGGSMVAQAAAKLGLTREEFEQQAIRYAAAQALESNAIDNRPASERPRAPSEAPPARSTMRPAARSGMYSAQPEARTSGRKR